MAVGTPGPRRNCARQRLLTGDLDLVRATADGFFEVMNDQFWMSDVESASGDFTLRREAIKRSADAKDVSTAGTVPDRSRRAQKNISLSGSPQLLHGVIHRISTTSSRSQ